MNPTLLAESHVALDIAPEPPVDLRRALWQRHARCGGHTDLFFAADGEQPPERRRREAGAIRLCAECPVREACRDAGRENREIGVWGGETDEDRAAAGFPPRNLARRSVMRAARAGPVRDAG